MNAFPLGFLDADHFVSYSSERVEDTMQYLITFYDYDIRSGEVRSISDTDLKITGVLYDGRYTLVGKADLEARKTKILCIDLETMEWTEKTVIPTIEYAVNDCFYYWYADNRLCFYDFRDGSEKVYEIPAQVSVSYAFLSNNYLHDGIVYFGTQTVDINGEKKTVYDFQYDLLSGQMRYTVEDHSAFYGPETPEYILYTKDGGEAK